MKKTLLLAACACFSMHSGYAQSITPVADLSPAHAEPSEYTIWNNKLYFFANDARNGVQIWSYDGHSAPQMVPNTLISFNGVSEMIVYKDKLYFSGETYAHGRELCSYDGVNPPKVELDLNPGTKNGFPANFYVFDGKPFFAGYAVGLGRELLSYDGVNPPTSYDVFPGSESGNPGNLISLANKLYFSPSLCALTGLWEFDPVKDSVRELPGIGIESYGYAIAGGGSLFFSGSSNAASPTLLYRYTGNGSLITLTKTSTNGIERTALAPTAFFNNSVCFLGINSDSTVGLYLYKLSDGSTRRITPLFYDARRAGFGSGWELHDVITFNGSLYFTALIDSAVGFELYKYDGNTVSLVADIRAGNKSGDPTSLAVYNGSLYMTADNGSTGRELYRLGHPTGIQSVSWNGDVQLYPNPATASATLSIRLPASQTLRVLLTDVSGRAAFNSGPRVFDAGRHDVKLPLQQVAAGPYRYSIIGSDGTLLAGGTLVKQ